MENAKTSKPERLFCLDLVRGLDIFFLTAFGPFVGWSLFHVWKAPTWMAAQLRHELTQFVGAGVAPTGTTLYDFAQPLFIFICGVAVPFSLPRRLDAEGRPTVAFWKHVAGRVALLWGLGCIIRGALTFKLETFSPYADTLQTIAVAYFASALSLLIKSRKLRFALPLVLLAIYGVVQATCGDYTRLGNISRIIDEAAFGAIGCKAKDFCYVFTTVAWAAMGALAALVGEILKRPDAPWRKVRVLAGWGAVSLVFGWILQIWIPSIRYIYTVSFVFTMFGYSMLLLDVLYVVTDIWKFRRGTALFILFGQSSLAAWMLHTNPFSGGLHAVSANLLVGLPNLFHTGPWQAVWVSLLQSVLLCVVLGYWSRLKRSAR